MELTASVLAAPAFGTTSAPGTTQASETNSSASASWPPSAALSGNAALSGGATLSDSAAESHPAGAPRVLLVLPSLGTSVAALWQAAATAFSALSPATTVIGIDLPGHGRSAPIPPLGATPAAPDAPSFPEPSALATADVSAANVPPLTIPILAEAVLATLDRVLPDVLGSEPTPFPQVAVAGDSIGGAIAQQLALDHPERFSHIAVFCTGARIGEPAAWIERANTVAVSGTPTQVSGSAQRWFAPGFMEREPEVSTALLNSLQDADRFSYAALCHALADFDVRDRLSDISLPLLAVAGAEDTPTPPTKLAEITNGVPGAQLEILKGAAHLVPAEAPGITAALLHDFLHPAAQVNGASGTDPGTTSAGLLTAAGRREADRDEVHAAGMQVRREVLSDAHVDRANAKITDFTADFQDLITRYAWGEIWTRPGLDRRMRSAITLTAMIAGGHETELAIHVQAAVRNGLSRAEIKEVLLQSAIYCSVPSANTAFAVAAQALEDMDEEG